MFRVTLFVFLLFLVNHYLVTDKLLGNDLLLKNLHNLFSVIGTPLMGYIFFLVCLCKILNTWPILMHLGLHFFIGMLIIFFVIINTIRDVDPKYFETFNTSYDLFFSRKMLVPLLYVFLGSSTFSIIEYFMVDKRL